MSLLRGIWSDLVDKRLWPVALVLVVAVVAIPVLLHKQADKVAGPSAASAAAVPRLPAAGSSISLNQGAAERLLVGGRLHDPFHQLHVPKAAATSAASALGPSQASSVTSTSTGQTGTGTPSSGGGGSSSGGAEAPGGRREGARELRQDRRVAEEL